MLVVKKHDDPSSLGNGFGKHNIAAFNSLVSEFKSLATV